MLTRWNQGFSDFDQMYSAMNQLRNYMDRVFEDDAGTWSGGMRTSWPRMNLADGGNTLTLSAEVPGLSEKDLTVTLNQEMVTISGNRQIEVPKGYSTHRQERPELQFSRSFTLPCSVNPERAHANVKDGILTLTLEKAPNAQPRTISVKAS